MLITSFLGSVLPTVFLVWLIWWADRYEREPVNMLAATFLWGAIPAIFLALIAELLLTLPLNPDALWGQFASTAIIAPVVEESVKGLALLALLRFTRPELDGALDGIVYGALVGAGFAMTENFFYFLGADNASSLQSLIFLRSGVFGLNHLFYTAVFGASVGFAARMGNRKAQLFVMALGLGGAIILHMLHNAATVLSQISLGFILLSTLFLWSGLVLFFFLVILLLARERRIIRDYLARDDAPAISVSAQKRLMAILPPPERFIPSAVLPKTARQRNQAYQLVAELAFRQHRLGRVRGARAQKLVGEMESLQAALDEALKHG